MKWLIYTHLIADRYEKTLYAYLAKFYGIQPNEVAIFPFMDNGTSKTLTGAVSRSIHDKRPKQVNNMLRILKLG